MGRNAKPQPRESDEAAASELEGHLSIETLSAYHRRILPAEQNAEVRSHIVLCPSCQALFLDLVRFLDDQGGPHTLSADEVTTAWKRLRQSDLASRAR